jgi:hypothetical protein
MAEKEVASLLEFMDFLYSIPCNRPDMRDRNAGLWHWGPVSMELVRCPALRASSPVPSLLSSQVTGICDTFS